MQISISILVANATSGISYVKRLIKSFKDRVSSDGGVFEAPACLAAQLEELRKDQLLSSASFLVTPNAVEENKLFAIVPSSGAGDLDVVRATTATLVNSAGLIEVTPYNLLQQSQTFENASWSKINAIITANATTAPNGTLSAEKLIANTTLDQHRIDQTPSSSAVSQTLSIYAKAGEYNFIGMRLGLTGSIFNLTIGSVVSSSSGIVGSIESVGNGWFRCSITKATGVANDVCRISISDGTTIAPNFSGNNVDGLFIWGAQLVTGTSAKEYFPTTDRLDVPRLDYTNSSCPSILVEPQRTNLVTYSELFNDTGWGKTNVTVTANTDISPDGNTTADKMFETITNGVHFVVPQNFSITSGTSYTASVFLKKTSTSPDWMQLAFSTFGLSGFANFNLTTGVIGNSGGSGGLTAKIENYGNGWYRCSITQVASATGSSTGPVIVFTNNTDPINRFVSYTGNASVNILVWGAQCEAGSNATSYIPTIASTVTRNADVISKTGISSLIGQTEGTIFCELNLKNLLGNQNRRIIAISNNNSASENIQLTFTSSLTNTIRAVISSGGNFPLITSTQITSLGKIKMALAYSTTDVVFYINGIKQGVDLGATTKPVMNFISLGSLNNTDFLNDNINSAILFNTRLTNSKLAQLTTI